MYNLFKIEGAGLRVANDLHPDFPKWISYTFKENHKPTTQLTAEQKNRLWKEHGGIFP